MSMTFLEALELSDEFIHPEKHLCGLCGNHGVIDTRGKVTSPAGVECGVKAFCVCANGRAMKRDEDRSKGKKAPAPKLFWVSWEEPSKPSPTEEDPDGRVVEDPEKTGERIISYWVSGWAGDGSYATVVAWVQASSASEVASAIDADWPSKEDRRWRFINPCEPGWNPGDRFPLSAEGKRRLKAISKK